MRPKILILLVCIPFVSASQNWVDLVNIYWRPSPYNQIEANDLQRNFSIYAADLKVPIPVNDDNTIYTSVAYDRTEINYVDPPTWAFNVLPLHSFQLQAGLIHQWNDKFKSFFIAIGRLNSDLRNIESSHLQLGGLNLNHYERSKDFIWQYGLYYNAEFFGPMFVPLFGFNWKINEEWRLKMVIPVNLELAYHPKNWFRTGLRFDGVNGSYRSITNGTIWHPERYCDRADNNVWLFSEFNLGANIWFHLKAGHSVLRKYRYYDNSDRMALKLGPVNIGDNRTQQVPLFENGWTFETRLIYRLPLD